MQNRAYNDRHRIAPWSSPMPRKKQTEATDFGQRLASLRKAAGYTQVELAEELGVSQRMISYYESHTEHPPSALLPELAKALGVTADELLGITPVKRARKRDTRLERRFQQIEKLGPKEKRQIMQLLDAFIEREQLKQKASR